ncbi:unnamed protein product [Soboliphyme baturini]|uniref:Uncharacterized protein n=1 Tax=Soboliphyme baturini TaxID=241478 RepID=A0A183IG04_9BILA|nr:unnamed protein product [Soboliphyme baturini]
MTLLMTALTRFSKRCSNPLKVTRRSQELNDATIIARLLKDLKNLRRCINRQVRAEPSFSVVSDDKPVRARLTVEEKIERKALHMENYRQRPKVSDEAVLQIRISSENRCFKGSFDDNPKKFAKGLRR